MIMSVIELSQISEVKMDSYTIVGNNGERSCVPFTRFLPLVIAYKTVV